MAAIFASLTKDYESKATVNSFFASSDFCRLLINFANSLDPDQD